MILFLPVRSRPPPPGASPPGAGPPPVVLSGVPPIAHLGPCEESSSVDVRDNQLDEFASQSILANVSVPASAGSFGSAQLGAEPQISNLSVPVASAASDVSSDNDSLVTVSEGEIASSSSNESIISEHSIVMDTTSPAKEGSGGSNVIVSESNVMENTTNPAKGGSSDSNVIVSNVMENTTSPAKEGSSVSNVIVNVSTSTIKENISNTMHSENRGITDSLPNSGANLVSPGSSLNSVSLPGGAEVPLSSVGCSDSAVRVSNVPSGLRLLKGSSSGVSKPAAARPSGLRPGIRKVISELSFSSKRKR